MQKVTIAKTSELIKFRAYNVFELFAFIGGLVVFFGIAFTYSLRPFQKHAFKMKALKRLYYAKTESENCFKIKNKK